MRVTSPFVSSNMSVEPQWIDYNGHLNMAYYHVLFDRALDEAALQLGLGEVYLSERGASYYTAECHVRYLRELHANDRVLVKVRLVDADEKRLHWWEELWTADEKTLSATSEQISLHVDITEKRVIPFPPDVRNAVRDWLDADHDLPRPDGLGRSIAIKRSV